jgi:hypothetical protein
VAKGVWHEPVEIQMSSGHSLEISGGWYSSYTRRDVDPSQTVIDVAGSRGGRVLVSGTGGAVSVSGFTITGGNGNTALFITPRGDQSVEFVGNRVSGNRAKLVIRALAQDTATLRFAENQIVENEAIYLHYGATVLSVSGVDDAKVLVTGNEFADNYAEANFSFVVHASVTDTAHVALSENLVEQNRQVSNGSAAPGVTVSCQGSGRGTLLAQRNDIQDNESGTQLSVEAAGSSLVRITDSLIARGSGHLGVFADVESRSTVQLTNLTVVDHPMYGVLVYAGSEESAFLSNSIVVGNGTNTAGALVETSNFVGRAPGFVDPGWDYHLLPFSLAVDAGAPSPPGGLGPLDLDGEPRVQGRAVDIGAYETQR